MISLKVARLHDAATLPTRATDGAACLDLFAVNEGYAPVLGADTAEFGIAVEVPRDHVMLIFSRSGHGFKNGVRLSNCVGVIDSDYRGPIKARLHNEGHTGFSWQRGERVAQAMVLPVPHVMVMEVAEEYLTETARGVGGMGSTGA